MEPVTCQGLENSAAPDKDADPSSQPPAGIDKARCGGVQGKTSALYLKMLSLRVGLVGWYFCLKKVQWDVVRWIYISLELATDVFFSWVQNALLAFMMLLLLAWKVRSGARQHGWRTLLRSLTAEVKHTWGQSLLRGRCCNLKSFVVWVAWAPACCFTWIIGYLVWALEAVFAHAVMMAGEDKVEEVAEDILPASLPPPVHQDEEREPSDGQ